MLTRVWCGAVALGYCTSVAQQVLLHTECVAVLISNAKLYGMWVITMVSYTLFFFIQQSIHQISILEKK